MGLWKGMMGLSEDKGAIIINGILMQHTLCIYGVCYRKTTIIPIQICNNLSGPIWSFIYLLYSAGIYKKNVFYKAILPEWAHCYGLIGQQDPADY